MMLELPANVPTWAWITGAVALAILAALGFRLLAIAARQRRARLALRHAGQQGAEVADAAGATDQPNDPASKRKERRAQRLVNVATGICIVLYLGLFASSFQAIAGFAKDFLKREGLLVPATPLTLDGVVIGALFLSMAFVAKRKSPAKANALIWGMTLFAAYCGFTYGDSGDHGSLAAGLYYAVMSIVGMFMFHMVLDLLQGDGDYVKSKYPSMGWRWITHWSTLPVMLAWINHPPRLKSAEEKDRPTVREAIDHWRHVKTIRARSKAINAADDHGRRLAQARRQAELAQARRAAELASATPLPAPVQTAHPYVGHESLPGFAQPHHNRPPQVVPLETATAARTITAPVHGGGDEQPSTSTKVPAGADACATWMEQWVKLVTDHPQFADGSRGISNADAQSSAGCSDRQARFVREAARAGLLRAKADELGVPVPAGYRDRPEDNRVNGARLAAVAS